MPDNFIDMFAHYLGNGVGVTPNNRAFALRYDPEAILRADKYNTMGRVVYKNTVGMDPQGANELMAGLLDRTKMQGPPRPLPYNGYLDLGRTQLPTFNGKGLLF